MAFVPEPDVARVPVALQSSFAAAAALIDRPAHALAVVTVAFFLSCAKAALDTVRDKCRANDDDFFACMFVVGF